MLKFYALHKCNFKREREAMFCIFPNFVWRYKFPYFIFYFLHVMIIRMRKLCHKFYLFIYFTCFYLFFLLTVSDYLHQLSTLLDTNIISMIRILSLEFYRLSFFLSAVFQINFFEYLIIYYIFSYIHTISYYFQELLLMLRG